MDDIIKAAKYVAENGAVREACMASRMIADKQFEQFAKLLASHLLRENALQATYKSAFE